MKKQDDRKDRKEHKEKIRFFVLFVFSAVVIFDLISTRA